MEKMHSAKEVPADDVDVQPGQTEEALGRDNTYPPDAHGEYQRAISPRQIHVRKSLQSTKRKKKC